MWLIIFLYLDSVQSELYIHKIINDLSVIIIIRHKRIFIFYLTLLQYQKFRKHFKTSNFVVCQFIIGQTLLHLICHQTNVCCIKPHHTDKLSTLFPQKSIISFLNLLKHLSYFLYFSKFCFLPPFP